MKIRNLLAVVAMISVLIFGIGTAYAVLGVADDVPGADVVIPIICEGQHDAQGGAPHFGTLNTLWAIADKAPSGEDCDISESVCTPHQGGPLAIGVVRTDVFVNDKNSNTLLDLSECWSKQDVIANDCQAMISQMSPDDQADMEVTVGGKTYFAGYIVYSQTDTCDGYENRFLPWVYINDAVRGYATGMNGISIENGIWTPGKNGDLAETCTGSWCGGDDAVAVTAEAVMPRYFILNNDPDTFNWWIFLLGRNQYVIGANTFTRQLTCVVCDEEENCFSRNINIPNELNIINVAGQIPGGLFTTPPGYPKAGFAFCGIAESGYLQGQNQQTIIDGTMSFDDDASTDPEFYSLFGWAYQRGTTTGLPVNTKLAVVHPVHRIYCMHHGSSTSTDRSDDLPIWFEDDGGTASGCTISGPVPAAPVGP